MLTPLFFATLMSVGAPSEEVPVFRMPWREPVRMVIPIRYRWVGERILVQRTEPQQPGVRSKGKPSLAEATVVIYGTMDDGFNDLREEVRVRYMPVFRQAYDLGEASSFTRQDLASFMYQCSNPNAPQNFHVSMDRFICTMPEMERLRGFRGVGGDAWRAQVGGIDIRR